MNWQALWSDGLVISLHALIAILAMAMGAIQLMGQKGTLCHRWLGYAWVSAMVVVSVSSFWVHEFRWWGPFSIIHVLSILVLATLTYSISAVRRGNVNAHQRSMVPTLSTGALAHWWLYVGSWADNACGTFWRLTTMTVRSRRKRQFGPVARRGTTRPFPS
ncbi:DUF2306 domain-containing protein [Pseudohaliea sp.]|uniref:DUF2306 domain-containing protein n=1 Tax=Pseudohaliea sp. TaxID=2740289 RepID=UPI0032ED3588